MEALHRDGRARSIGISNVSLAQLELTCEAAAVPPAFVQNRCYARTGWDREVRAFARRHEMVYQGFSLLTANRAELATPAVAAIAGRLGATVPQIVFAFARAVDMLALTGTTDPRHMSEDLASSAIALEPADVAVIEAIAGSAG